MKKLLLIIPFITLSALADVESTQQVDVVETNPSLLHSGFKIAGIFGQRTMNYEERVNYTFEDDVTYDSEQNYLATGLSLGFERAKSSGNWGFSVLASFINLKHEDESRLDMLETKLEGNAIVGISEKAYLSFGGSLSSLSSDEKIVQENLLDELSTGVGTQVSGSYKINSNFALELKLDYNIYSAVTDYDEESDSWRDIRMTNSTLTIGTTGVF